MIDFDALDGMTPAELEELRRRWRLLDSEIGRKLFQGQMAARAIGGFLRANSQCPARVGIGKGVRCDRLIGHEGIHFAGQVRWNEVASAEGTLDPANGRVDVEQLTGVDAAQVDGGADEQRLGHQITKTPS